MARLTKKALRTRRKLRRNARKQVRCADCGSFYRMGTDCKACPKRHVRPRALEDAMLSMAATVPDAFRGKVQKPEQETPRIAVILAMRKLACEVGVPAVIRVEAAKLGLEIHT